MSESTFEVYDASPRHGPHQFEVHEVFTDGHFRVTASFRDEDEAHAYANWRNS